MVEKIVIKDNSAALNYNIVKLREENKKLENRLDKIKTDVTGRLTELDEIETKFGELREILIKSINYDKEENKNKNNIEQSFIQNQERLTTTRNNIEIVLSESGEELKELEPLEIVFKMGQLEDDTIDTIKSSDSNGKYIALDRLQHMLAKLKKIKAENQTKFDNLLVWSTSFLSDQFPLVPHMLIVYTSLTNIIDSNFDVDQCDTVYVISRWTILGVIVLYLTYIGYKISKFRGYPLLFLRTFFLNYVVLLLMMVVQLSFPPISCYYQINWIGFAGVIGIVTLAVLLWLWSKPIIKYYCYKGVGNVIKLNKWQSKPFMIEGVDQSSDVQWIYHPSESVMITKPDEPIPYISAIYYKVNDGLLNITKIDLNGSGDIDYVLQKYTIFGKCIVV